LLCADIGEGTLPHWYREHERTPDADSLGPQFERQLEAAKGHGKRRPPEANARFDDEQFYETMNKAAPASVSWCDLY